MSRRWHYESGPLEKANEELTVLWREIDRVKRTGTGQTVVAKISGSSETEVRHGLGRVPEHVFPTPRANANVWETRPATATSAFLQASADVECSIRFV